MRTPQPAISYLTALELVSARSREIRGRELTSADGNRILSQFHAHSEQQLFRWIAIELKHHRTAKGNIAQFTISIRTINRS